jgi:NDP-sugar pyrophosphorylase family protein
MILAAGLGTRLRPLTHTVSKSMIPICNRPLIAWMVETLLREDIRDVVVNLHHLPDAIRNYLPTAFPEAHFDFSLEQNILGTGGAIRRVRPLLEGEDEFLVINGDTVHFPNYDLLRRARRERDSVAAIVLRHAPENDEFTAVWHDSGLVTGFGKGSGEPLMFSGVHLLSSRIFSYFPDRDVFGVVDEVYRPLLESGRETIAAIVDDGPWFDIGTPLRYLSASRALCKEHSSVGARTVIEGTIRDSVVWDDCYIGPEVTLESCIVAHGVELRSAMHLRNAVVCRGEEGLVMTAIV